MQKPAARKGRPPGRNEPYPDWQQRGYKDTRNRNQRRFFMLEKVDTTEMLMRRARSKLARIRGVPDTEQALPNAEVMRESLKAFINE